MRFHELSDGLLGDASSATSVGLSQFLGFVGKGRLVSKVVRSGVSNISCSFGRYCSVNSTS